MKSKYNPIIALFSTFFGITVLQAQNLYVRPVTGNQVTYGLSNISKLTFTGGNLVITPNTGSTSTFTVSSMRYLSFTDLTLDTPTNSLNETAFYVYPNPVHSNLNLFIADETQVIEEITIISMDGRLLFKQNQLSNQTLQVNVADYPLGIYFCNIKSNNKTQTIKFLKQ